MDMLEQISSPTSKVVDAFGTAVSKVVTPIKNLMMTRDPIALLIDQHQEFRTLVSEYKNLGKDAYKSKQKLAFQMIDLIQLHAKLEEKFFYPHAERLDVARTLESFEEHGNIDHMISRIKRTKPDHKSFDAKIETFRELIDHHAGEEERGLFPECRLRFSTELMETIFANMAKFIATAPKATKASAAVAKKAKSASAKRRPARRLAKPTAKQKAARLARRNAH